MAFTECLGGAPLVAERVMEGTVNQLLWVQLRSRDRATANRVLDAVDMHGM